MHPELCVSKRYNYGVVEYAFPPQLLYSRNWPGASAKKGGFLVVKLVISRNIVGSRPNKKVGISTSVSWNVSQVFFTSSFFWLETFSSIWLFMMEKKILANLQALCLKIHKRPSYFVVQKDQKDENFVNPYWYMRNFWCSISLCNEMYPRCI